MHSKPPSNRQKSQSEYPGPKHRKNESRPIYSAHKALRGTRAGGAFLSLIALAACGGGGTSSATPQTTTNTGIETQTGNTPSNLHINYSVLAENVISTPTSSNNETWAEGGYTIQSEEVWLRFLRENGLSSTAPIDFRVHDVLVYRKLTNSSCGNIAFRDLRQARLEELSSAESNKLVFTAAVDPDGTQANTDLQSCLASVQIKNILVQVNKLHIPIEYREIKLTH